MAATAHSDPYAIFLRKIGYSVGLEFTAARVEGMVVRYLQDRDLTVASWHDLVTGDKDKGNWGREKSAEKHFSDFYQSLRLIQRTPGDILVLENLDAIAICTELLGPEEQRSALNFLLLWAILVNDGEIFVNLLLAGFEEKNIKDTLGAMLRQKLEDAYKYMPGKAHARRLKRVISIERQTTNKGSAGTGQSVTSLKRTQPLQLEAAAVSTTETDVEIELSSDYFRKVPPRRKEWAVSLGLWDDDAGITQRGRNFIKGLREAGYINEHNYFTFWPMDYELVRSGFRSDLLGENTKSLWICLVEFGAAYAGLSVREHADGDAEMAVDIIRNMTGVYRSLHVRKAMLRRELPITIVYPAVVAIACANTESVLDLPAAILSEQKGEQRRVAFRQSRNSGGALSLKK